MLACQCTHKQALNVASDLDETWHTLEQRKVLVNSCYIYIYRTIPKWNAFSGLRNDYTGLGPLLIDSLPNLNSVVNILMN